ncbi:MAG: hypothetical protein WCL38_08555 [Actinomycetota bacterium]
MRRRGDQPVTWALLTAASLGVACLGFLVPSQIISRAGRVSEQPVVKALQRTTSRSSVAPGNLPQRTTTVNQFLKVTGVAKNLRQPSLPPSSLPSTTTTSAAPPQAVEPTAFALPHPHIVGYVDAPTAALATYLFHGDLAGAEVTIKNESSGDLLVTLGSGDPAVLSAGSSRSIALPLGDNSLVSTATTQGVQSYSLTYIGASL